MTIPTYVIRGGPEGRERLRVLSRVLWPTTSTLLARAGIRGDARCLDVGCGGGDVTVALAQMAPAGHVVGVDLDEAKLALARAEAADARIANVEFRTGDVLQRASESDRFDLIYMRFLLTHLTDPAAAVANVVAQLAPGGVLVVEDVDCSGHFCHPESAAFRNYVSWYSDAVRGRGADPDIGPRLPGLLANAGLVEVGMHVEQPAGTTGEVKLLCPITLEAIADAVLTAGLATDEEFRQTVDELYAFAQTDGTVMSIPRIVQSWGRRSLYER
jgi:SAM-dependent methyltransferase